MVPLRAFVLSMLSFRPDFTSLAVGVRHNPDSIAAVKRVDGTSRNNNRPCGVSDAFQVSKYTVERHADEPSNVFTQDVAGSFCLNNPRHFRPEVTVIFAASALPGNTERLAGESSGNKVNWAELPWFVCSDVIVLRHLRPMLIQYAAAPLVNLAEPNGFMPEPADRECKAANATEKVQVTNHAVTSTPRHSRFCRLFRSRLHASPHTTASGLFDVNAAPHSSQVSSYGSTARSFDLRRA